MLNGPCSRGSYGQKDLFSAMSLETLPLIGHDSMMCKDQEYVKKYTYDIISHVLYQCWMRVFNFDSL